MKTMKTIFYFAALALAMSVHMACGANHKQARGPVAERESSAPDTSTKTPPDHADRSPDADDDDETQVIDLEPIRIEVVGRDRVGDPELEAFDARTLLDRGNAAMAEERYDDAIASYEKLLAVFPDSQLAGAATYNIGLAYEALDDMETAIDTYRVLARDAKGGKEAVDAHMRIAALFSEMQRWDDALEVLREVSNRPDLTHSDRIQAMARMGYVSLEKKDYTTAESTLGDAVTYYKKLTQGLESNYFIAMAYYYLAQIPHRQFRAMPMRLPDAQLRKDFTNKSDLVARAYDRYVDAIQIQNAYWATASGYQLSQIYKELWDDIVLAPVPDQLDPEAAKIYVRELHNEVRVLLDKAMEGHARNVELAQAYRTSNAWSEGSRVRAAEIAEILARESGGELVTPERKDTPGATDAAKNGEAREYVPSRVEL